ncbi:MAG: hypothetical protein IT584_03500, partial [Chlamydiae bacterium]|nr:hypothetical protein [Chlamydiota bacterium]
SVRVLVKRFNTLLSQNREASEPNPPELDAVIRICKITRLFFNGPSHRLDYLFSKIFSVPKNDLHPLQWAAHPDFACHWMPSPPKSCWSHPLRWSHEDWPEDHLTSWDCVYSLLQGLVCLDSCYSTIAESGEIVAGTGGFLEDIWAAQFAGNPTFDLLKGIASQKSDLCVKFSLSELKRSERLGIANWPSEINERVSDTSWNRVRLNLLRTGVPPFMIIDLSEAFTKKPTQWARGAQSKWFIYFFGVVCEFGTKEEIEVLMENPEPIRSYYAALEDFSDTLYKRAVRNPWPDVLIPFLKEAALDPGGGLAREIRQSDFEPEKPRAFWSYLGLWPRYESWRSCRKNHLILACVEGSLELARHLVEEKEREAEAAVSREEDEIGRIAKAAEIVSEFVNRPGSSGAPSTVPLDIAMEAGYTQLAEFLCSKGAQASPGFDEQMEGNLSDQMADILKRSRAVQEKLCQQIKAQGHNLTITNQLVGQLSRIEAQSREFLERMQEQVSRNDALGKGIEKSLEESKKNLAMLQTLNRHLELFEKAQNYVLIEEARRQEPSYRVASASSTSVIDVY